MPIKPEYRKYYGYAWQKGREADLIRAGYECENCHCGDQPMGLVSTLHRAHLDGNPANGDPENIAVLCLWCHWDHDYPRWAAGEVIRRAAARELRLDRNDGARAILQPFIQKEVPCLTFTVPPARPWLKS